MYSFSELATWDDFLKRLRGFGVEVHRTRGKGFPYLRRVVNGQMLTFVLPRDFDEKNPAASGIVGTWVISAACRQLALPEPALGYIQGIH